jgi:hypothetical protein
MRFSLERLKIYVALPDAKALRTGQLRLAVHEDGSVHGVITNEVQLKI